jgi:hypothetical protein
VAAVRLKLRSWLRFRDRVLRRRSDYEGGFRRLIERGAAEGVFAVRSARLASYSILDMGIGVSAWFSEGGEFSADQIAYQYGDIALRLVGAATSVAGRRPSPPGVPSTTRSANRSVP